MAIIYKVIGTRPSSIIIIFFIKFIFFCFFEIVKAKISIKSEILAFKNALNSILTLF